MQDRTPTTDPMTVHYTAAARELLDALDRLDYADTREAFRLLGGAEVVLAGLLHIIETR